MQIICLVVKDNTSKLDALPSTPLGERLPHKRGGRHGKARAAWPLTGAAALSRPTSPGQHGDPPRFIAVMEQIRIPGVERAVLGGLVLRLTALSMLIIANAYRRLDLVGASHPVARS